VGYHLKKHFQNLRYDVYGCEISVDAVEKSKKRIDNVLLLKLEDEQLPYENDFFDYILCNQVLYFLGDKQNIIHCLEEFNRVLKPSGKLIVTVFSRFNDGCIMGKPLDDNVYLWNGLKSYVFIDEKQVRNIFSMFDIVEIGYFDNCYCNVRGHHWVILANKKI